MVELSVLPAFLVAVVLISASPGPAMALIFQRAGAHGFRAAIPTVLGLELGLFCWALAAGFGLAALVAASEAAFWALRILGAGVLGFLGIKALLAGWRLRGSSGGDEGARLMPAAPDAGSHRGAFVGALMVQLANPKAAIFLMAFYPQFLPASGPVLGPTVALGLIQVSVEMVLYLGLAAAVGRAATWFSRTSIRRRLDYTSGVVLLGLGARVALTSRPVV
jgi:threonine/homoserine/homoserine lactone efflux protein